jgi:hypothetical protein
MPGSTDAAALVKSKTDGFEASSFVDTGPSEGISRPASEITTAPGLVTGRTLVTTTRAFGHPSSVSVTTPN